MTALTTLEDVHSGNIEREIGATGPDGAGVTSRVICSVTPRQMSHTPT